MNQIKDAVAISKSPVPIRLDSESSKLKFSMPSQAEMVQLIDFCKVMASAPFYQKLGPGGVMAIYLTAKEFNVPFMASLNGGMHTFDGKVTFSAQLINAMIINAGHTADILHLDDQKCVIHFKRGDRHDSEYKGFTYEYTIKQAERAGYLTKANWKNNPKDMLFSRCLTGGGRKHVPEIFVGVLVAGELMGDNRDGDIQPLSPVNVTESNNQTQKNVVESNNAVIYPKLVEDEYNSNYTDFILKHGLLGNSDGTCSRKLEFLRKSADKAKISQGKVIDFAMKNESDFLEKFDKWEKENYPKEKITSMDQVALDQ